MRFLALRRNSFVNDLTPRWGGIDDHPGAGDVRQFLFPV